VIKIILEMNHFQATGFVMILFAVCSSFVYGDCASQKVFLVWIEP